ncbi:MAG: putative sulfate exporter family transporter [Chlorobia bacterium]|nr:putative sulfate exporter family transporter [Fimbriimonadaceae bacterium]
MTLAKAIFLIGLAICLIPLTPPWAALILGIAIALILGNPFPTESKNVSKVLLQVCVVLLGFSMDLNTVLKAGSQGILFALASIVGVFLLGWGLQRALGLRPVAGLLVSTGTAICGGSAIAAMSTVTDADQEDVSVAVGTVFILNAIALLIFPPLGHYFGLTQAQFGTWAGIAIHDVASVVGAGKAYGPEALDVGTAVKLSRVLYLIPITLIAAWWIRNQGRRAEGGGTRESGDEEGRTRPSNTPFPYFILGFIAASVVRTYVPVIGDFAPTIKMAASIGLAVALYLIGAGITRKTLQTVGVRPLIQGVVLWVFISVTSFFVVQNL